MSNLPFERSDEFEALLEARGFPEMATAFLMLCFQAANGTAPAGILGDFVPDPEPVYVMTSDIGQYALARFCGMQSDRTLRRTCDQLGTAGIVVKRTTRTTRTAAGKQTVYVVRIRRILELPAVSSDNPLASICNVLRTHGVAGLLGTADENSERHVVDEENPRLAELIGGIRPMDGKRMTAIEDSDVRLIAGFAHGRPSPLSVQERLELFAGYWRDCKLRENLTSADCVELLALFLHWGKNKPTLKAGKSSENARGRMIATYWRNRRTMPLAKSVKEQDFREARTMLETRRTPPPDPAPVQPVQGTQVPAPPAKERPSVPELVRKVTTRSFASAYQSTAGYRERMTLEGEE